MSPILRAADMLWRWSFQVDDTHAKPGTIEAMRQLATEVRAEYSRLQRPADADLERLIKAWAARELDALPRGPWNDWSNSGTLPRSLQPALARLPEPVAELVRAHVADPMGECECCRRRAPCRLQSDGTDSGERDWRCAWGCPPPEDDPAETEALLMWAREAGI